ncbi:MAG: asparagine synthase-related protein [Thermoplasmata archaeon]
MRGESLYEALGEGVREACEGYGSVALAFSGGLDSSVIAAFTRDTTSVITYTVGYASSQDLTNAQEASGTLGLSWVPIELEDSLLVREARSLLRHFPGLDPVTLSFELPLWILLDRCSDTVVLAGQGADELFGGYAKYQRLEGGALQKALDRDLELLMMETVPREREMAGHRGRILKLPYCHPRVMSIVLSLSTEEKVGPRGKEALRRVARQLDLPEFLVQRPKKAVQYGSGVMKRLKGLAKAERMGVADFVLSLG